MKIAALVLSHADLSLVCLHARFFPEIHFYVHIDRRSKTVVGPSILPSLRNVHFVDKGFKTGWAGFNLVKATILLLTEASKNDFDYCLIMSESCLLLKNQAQLRTVCSQLNKRSVVRMHRAYSPGVVPDERNGRLFKLNFNDCQMFNPKANLQGALAKLISRFMRSSLANVNRFFLTYRTPPTNLFKGSQWMLIHRDAIRTIINSTLGQQFFKYSFAPDETYLQTILFSEIDRSKIIDSADMATNEIDLMFQDWSGKEKPKILEADDFGRIRDSNCLCCRKVNTEKSFQLIERVALGWSEKNDCLDISSLLLEKRISYRVTKLTSQ